MRRHHIAILALSLLLGGCSLTKYVPEGKYLLDDVKIESDNPEVRPSEFYSYLRQQPNAKWFNLMKTQLYIYNLSGRDSTGKFNKFLRRLGNPPVIFDQTEAERTKLELQNAVRNMGYMGAQVEMHTTAKKKKLKEYFQIIAGEPYLVDRLCFVIPNRRMAAIADTSATLLSKGMVFDVAVLEKERARIARNLQNNGYYKFNKDYITYTADTVMGRKSIDLTMHIAPFDREDRGDLASHRPYRVDSVYFLADYNLLQSHISMKDSLIYRDYPIFYNRKLFLRPKILLQNLAIRRGALYNQSEVEQTYSNFGRLQAVRYTNIRFLEKERNGEKLLDAVVQLSRNKNKSVAVEVEGTNSSGDLGAGLSLSFNHRNLFKGSESFLFKVHGNYEAITGLTGRYKHSNYNEFGAETSIKFPRFMFPFIPEKYKRGIRANTEFGLQYNYQLRPEFQRIISSAHWSYLWGFRQQHFRHRIDLVDINYLYMPWISNDFYDRYIANVNNYIARYNYSDRFIVKSSYGFVYNSLGQHFMNNVALNNAYTVRFNVESAGNLLYLMARAVHSHKNDKGEYTLLNIPFAQYVKADLDFSKNILIDRKNSFNIHLGGGVAIPYGNGNVVPFEKRYFSGGANSVRGWSVRSLGPGIFPGDGNVFNQSGDIKLDMNIEYRTYLFWKFRGALFLDAGNIWTIRDYKDQPGGQFKFNKFYNQIAVAYGAGVRLDLDFFILRMDGGMKAVNPIYSNSREHFPIAHPNFKRDFALHIAIGYPF